MTSVRRDMLKWMDDEIAIWRGGSSTANTNTLIESPVQGNLVLQSKCRISPSRGPREITVGEDVIIMRDVDILLPWNSEIPRRDDEVNVISSFLDTLVGSWYRITDVRVHSHQATLKFSAIQSQPSRTWPLLIPDEED